MPYSFKGLKILVPHWGGEKIFSAGKIALYQSGVSTHVGGVANSLFGGSTANLSGSTTGRTFINNLVAQGILQDGLVRRCVVKVSQVGAAQQIKFKVFRYNGVTWDFVAESEVFNITVLGNITFDLTTPMPCQPGDYIGCWITGAALAFNQSNIAAMPGSCRFAAGDITTTNAFASTAAASLCLDAMSNRPFFVGTGDSIGEGHTTYHSFYHTGPAGTVTNEIWNQIRARFATVEYQNHAMGSQTFAWVASTGIVSAVAVDPYAVIVHCGVNDVSGGRTWAAVEADLNTIKAAVGTRKLLIDEILPWTDGTDGQAATVRTWNTNLATWCAANGATLVRCHDAMGQIRPSTGELDDLLAAYDQDGVHLTTAGVDALAAIIARY